MPCLFMGCTKKDRLVNNTMLVSIEPNVVGILGTMKIGDVERLSAVIRNSKLEEIDEPVSWSVTNGLGVFTSQNKITDFIAQNQGSGQIILTCQGMSASVNVTVEL